MCGNSQGGFNELTDSSPQTKAFSLRLSCSSALTGWRGWEGGRRWSRRQPMAAPWAWRPMQSLSTKATAAAAAAAAASGFREDRTRGGGGSFTCCSVNKWSTNNPSFLCRLYLDSKRCIIGSWTGANFWKDVNFWSHSQLFPKNRI